MSKRSTAVDFTAGNTIPSSRFRAVARRILQDIPSWGLNTIANSSDPLIYGRRQTSYTAIVYSAPIGRSDFRIEGSGGTWGKLPDPFDPGWRRFIDDTFRKEHQDSVRDPWCLGFFVDNELAWGSAPTYLAEVVLRSPAGQPAKRALTGELRRKCGGVEALNRAWSTRHASWEALLAAAVPPDNKLPAVAEDLAAFSQSLTDAYFRGCHDAVKAAAPNHMYLGSRFAGVAHRRIPLWGFGPRSVRCGTGPCGEPEGPRPRVSNVRLERDRESCHRRDALVPVLRSARHGPL